MLYRRAMEKRLLLRGFDLRSERMLAKFHVLRLLRHTLVENALSLFGVQIASYIVPLITIPYLARVLGVTGWGMVAFAQAFGSYVALFGEYGFALSATREVARYRDDREKLTGILAGVLGAKTLLALASLAIALLVRWWVPMFREYPELLWSALFWALARAFSMMWFFQGLERMRLVSVLEISGQALATLGIFVLIRRPTDASRVLAVQGLGFFLSFLVGLGLAYSELPFRMPSWSSMWEALRMGWTMFLFRGSVSLYTAGNAFILGLFAPPQFVGYYSGAERISKAFLGLLNPVSQTLYPRLSRLVHDARDRAAELARIALVVMGVGGTVLGVSVFLLAPMLVHVVLGRDFEAAVPVVQILSLLLPLIALSNVFGIQWMLPLGLDRSFNTIIMLAGLINIALAVMLAGFYGELGMAWAVVSAEAFVTASMYVLLRRWKLDPMSYPRKMERGIV